MSVEKSSEIRVGLISDTHGLLRPEALVALRGSDLIIHAGDVGAPGILSALAEIAPLAAVSGNIDKTSAWPDCVWLEIGAITICAHHGHLVSAPEAADLGARVIVSGHSHRASVEERAGTLFVNPGSAGPRRFRLPITVAELLVRGDSVEARIIPLPLA